MKLRVNRGYREYSKEDSPPDYVTEDDIIREYFVSMYIEPENDEDMKLIDKMHRLKMYREFEIDFVGSTPKEAEEKYEKNKGELIRKYGEWLDKIRRAKEEEFKL